MRTARTIDSLNTSPVTLSKHAFLSPPVITKQSNQGSALVTSETAARVVLSMDTKTMEKKTTSAMMTNTTRIPRHCSSITLRTLR